MDDWLFISLAKTKADAPNFKRRAAAPGAGLSKSDTAAALDYEAVFDHAGARAVVALAAAILVNVAFLSAIERTTLEAGAPRGEVIVAEIDPSPELPVYAQVAARDRATAL